MFVRNKLEYIYLTRKQYSIGGGGGKWCVAKYGDPYLEFVLCI